MMGLFYYTCFLFAMLNVATINVQGLRDHRKRQGVFQSLQLGRCDIIALQETHADHSVISTWQNEWPGLSCWSAASPTSAGVALLFSQNLNISILCEQSDTQGRVLRVSVELDQNKLQFLCVYGPNPALLSASNHFFRGLESYIDQDLPLILLGDFNMVELPFEDRYGGNIRLPSHVYGRHELQRLLARHNLADAWRHVNPSKRSFTWHCKYKNVHSRIDRIYVPKSFITHITSSFIHHFVWSDHDVCGVHVTLPTHQVRGKGYWKLNTQFLTHQLYRDRVRAFWLDWQNNRPDFDSDLLWWDCGKSYIKALTIDYAHELNSERKSRKCDLLDELSRERVLPTPDVARLRIIEHELLELERLRNEKIFAHTHTVIREHREMPNRYFFNLLRTRQKEATIPALFASDGSLVDTKDELLHTAVEYYSQLYTAHSTVSEDSQNEFLSGITASLTTVQQDVLHKDIVLDELTKVVVDCPHGKTAG